MFQDLAIICKIIFNFLCVCKHKADLHTHGEYTKGEPRRIFQERAIFKRLRSIFMLLPGTTHLKLRNSKQRV